MQSIDAVLLLLVSLGYTVRHESNTKTTKFFILTDQDRSVELQKIHKAIPQSVLIPKSYHSSKGHVQTEDKKFVFVTKPLSTGATENLRINSSKMSKLGELKIVDLFGYKNVECRELNSKDELIASVLDEFNTNPQISDDIRSTWTAYFTDSNRDSNKILWSGKTGFSEKNELGKYLGEIILGYFAFCGKIPNISIPKSILFPKSARFSGIDLATNNGNKLTCFSHKFGVGAKASFFSNLLPDVLKKESSITKDMALYGLLQSLESVDNDTSRAREIVYHYGVRSILKIGKNRIKHPFEDVYRSIVNKKPNKQAISLVISNIKILCDQESIISKLIPSKKYSSLTGFFTREMANKINSCSKSVNLLKSILAKKDFYQANLNTEKWLNGEISYTWIHSKKASLNLIGTKCSLSDISDSGSGLVGYIIK